MVLVAFVVDALVATRRGSESGPAKVEVAVVEVAVKYGAEMFVSEEIVPVAVTVPDNESAPRLSVLNMAVSPVTREKS